MNRSQDHQRPPLPLAQRPILLTPQPPPHEQRPAHCDLKEGHCLTCADEALLARVVQIDELAGTALVTVDNPGQRPATDGIATATRTGDNYPTTRDHDVQAIGNNGPAEEQTTLEVDISLVAGVAPGDLLLVHGGVAIEHLEA